MQFRFIVKACLLAASLTQAAPASTGSQEVSSSEHDVRATTSRLVFCHFMIGIVGDRTSAADYDADMKRAKSLGIDAFALNIGVDPYTDTQLGYAYESAANNGMNVFISFDFNWYHASSDAAAVGQMIAKYGKLAAQLKVDNKVFASSFAGDGLDVAAMRSAAGVDVFWAPNFHPEQTSSPANIDGALNWMAWDNNGNNKAPTAGANITVQAGDDNYKKWLGSKPLIAPVSPWFSTHFGPEVSYSKNWVFPGDLLWYRRWNEILSTGPQFLEIITWNDYGESHYIGPLSSKHWDDNSSKFVNDMPHDANNDSGNYFMGRPNGYESMQDAVFIVSLLTSAGTVTVTSGKNSQTFNAPAGAAAFQVPMAVGKQTFSLSRNSKVVMSSTSLKDISEICICGIYNFNAYVGTVPDGFSDPLGTDAIFGHSDWRRINANNNRSRWQFALHNDLKSISRGHNDRRAVKHTEEHNIQGPDPD
ncbi:putative alpha- -glucanase protein [Phaeoacremonium minimum UCRPA7]|uniref:Putative alpha--glucanase protein n=1 Tax=Phaeoacremonium minimum (strain UCR-PA7) TaxID=1286976 RepID=R8BDZ4_PHAM7|nr:putative alpha- -glucanase protein [Phaeoacremonium minimum UCRPA7]EON97526.1 putative alpha- -glucanase protein [Phaeoacremonium minimum UCRPA7]